VADLVVQDLQDLIDDLKYLTDQFRGALDWQNAGKGNWGQKNANSTMGDFAANWRIHRDKMVKAMDSFGKTVQDCEDYWKSQEASVRATLEAHQ
jgi:hypothetical protein